MINLHMKNKVLTFAGVIGFLFSNLTYAHPGHNESIGFLAGLMHPLSGFDHLLVIVLVGFWSAFMLKKFWLGPVLFILGMCIGVFAGLGNVSFNYFEFGVAASVIAIGLLMLLQRQFSSKGILALIGGFGVFHGFAHAEIFSNQAFEISMVLEDMVGLILATATLHLLGALSVKFLKEKASVIARVTGFASVIYGWVLLSQIAFAVIGGASA